MNDDTKQGLLPHSPTPWTYQKANNRRSYFWDANGKNVGAGAQNDNRRQKKADNELIRRAVNAWNDPIALSIRLAELEGRL